MFWVRLVTVVTDFGRLYLWLVVIGELTSKDDLTSQPLNKFLELQRTLVFVLSLIGARTFILL